MKKAFAVILLLAVVLSFAACGGENKTTKIISFDDLPCHPLDMTAEQFNEYFDEAKPDIQNPLKWERDLVLKVFRVDIGNEDEPAASNPFNQPAVVFEILFGVPMPEGDSPLDWPSDVFERAYGFPKPSAEDPLCHHPDRYEDLFNKPMPDLSDPLGLSPTEFEILYSVPKPNVKDPLDLSAEMYELLFQMSHPSPELEETPASEFEYTQEKGFGITITKYIGNSETVVIPSHIGGESVYKLDAKSFSPENGVSPIKHVVISEGISHIMPYAFAGQTTLEDVSIPLSTREINSYAFSGCTSLTNPIIRGTSLYIGWFAFSDCTNIDTITYESGVRSGCSNALMGLSNLKTVVIGKNVDNVEFDSTLASIAGYANIESVQVDSDNAYFKSIDGVLYSKDMTTLIHYPQGKTTEEYTVPNTVKVINTGVGKFNQYIKKVTIPEGVSDIKDMVFAFCVNLEKVYLPESVVTINQSAFSKYGINVILPLTLYVKDGSNAQTYANKYSHQYKFSVSLY